MAIAFSWKRSRSGQVPILRELEMVPSVSISAGDVLEFTDSKIARISAQTDHAKYVANIDATSTATGGEKVQVMDAMIGDGIWEVAFTPLINDQVATAGTTTTASVPLAAGDADDLNGGLLYCVELDETRIITDSSAVSMGSVDLTVTYPFSAALLGKTLRVVPFGFGDEAVKFKASTPYNGISTAIADLASGFCSIYDVDMKNKLAQVVFL